jgi:hypothetical protein
MEDGRARRRRRRARRTGAATGAAAGPGVAGAAAGAAAADAPSPQPPPDAGCGVRGGGPGTCTAAAGGAVRAGSIRDALVWLGGSAAADSAGRGREAGNHRELRREPLQRDFGQRHNALHVGVKWLRLFSGSFWASLLWLSFVAGSSDINTQQ